MVQWPADRLSAARLPPTKSIMQYLFVVTYGRSGSTALINLLNAIDGYCIRGENGGVIAQLAKAAHTLHASHTEQTRPRNTGPDSPWYGIDQAQPEGFARALADEFICGVLAPPTGTRVTGFKEIRYMPQHLSDDEFNQTITFMAANFANSRFIFNTRDAGEVSRSGWWATSKKHSASDVKKLVTQSDARFQSWNDKLQERAFMVDHAQYDGKPEGFGPLLDWLGEELPAQRLEEISQERLNHLKTDKAKEKQSPSRLRGWLKSK